MESCMKKFGKFLFGAMLGGFLGSTLVLLFAPESGEKTREAFRYRFSSFTAQIKDAINERKAELQEELEQYKTGKEESV